MTLGEWATLVALLVNLAALTVVGYQTFLTRQSLNTTRDSLQLTAESVAVAKQSADLAVRSMHIDMLPNANWVIGAQTDLRIWLEDLEDTIQSMQLAGAMRDADQMQQLAQRGLKSPGGLVRRHAIEHAPEWLATIWLAGAQYYYDAKAPQLFLWETKHDAPNYSFIANLVRRFEDSCHGLKDLLAMIDDVVPDAYLYSPASLSDDRFLD